MIDTTQLSEMIKGIRHIKIICLKTHLTYEKSGPEYIVGDSHNYGDVKQTPMLKLCDCPVADPDISFVGRQGRINHSGATYQRKAWALFSYAYPGFSLGVHFSAPKKLTTFLVVVVTLKPTLHVQTFIRQHNVVKFGS